MRTLVPEKTQSNEGTAVSTKEIQNNSFYCVLEEWARCWFSPRRE